MPIAPDIRGFQLHVLVVVLCMLACVGRAVENETPMGRHVWDTETGLPQNTIHSIVQTNDGYLWAATDAGLVRFNGYDFVTFNHANTPSLKSDRIRHLFVDTDGFLWASTASGLVRFRSTQSQGFSSESGLPSNDVWFVYQGRDGRLWVATAAGLAQFLNGRFVQVTTEEVNGITSASDGSLWVGTSNSLIHLRDAVIQEHVQVPGVRALCTDRDGRIWAGTREGLGKLENVEPNRSLLRSVLSRDIEALLCDGSGRVWAGGPGGLSLVEQNKARLVPLNEELPSKGIQAIYETKNGTIWISTNRGLVRWIDGHISAVRPQDSSRDLVLSFFEDREGNLWLGSQTGGLEVLRKQKFWSYNTELGLADDHISAIYQDRTGTVWVGTVGGGLSQSQRGNKFKTYDTDNGLSSNVILALAGDREGRLWIGTPDGLNLLDHGHFTLFTSADGLPDEFVRSLYEDSQGALWIGTRRGLSRFKDGRFTTYTRSDGLPSDLVGAILDQQDSLWIGTLNGLSRLRDNRFTTYSTSDGLASNVITSLYGDKNGALWIGTEGGGLHRRKDEKIVAFPARLGLPQTIYAILQDDDAFLWLASPQGITRVRLSDLDAFAEGKTKKIEVASYGTSDGMRTRECSSGAHPSAWKLADGSLWFATLKGIAAVAPHRIIVNSVPPPVSIEQILLDGDMITPEQATEIPPGHSRVSFQFATLSFVAPEKNRFRYMLEGFDRNWVETTDRRSVSYTNLRPGRYIFHVLAANNDGVWNNAGASFAFRLRPAFYQTLWFYAVCGLASILLSYWLYVARMKSVRSRFVAVLEERQRIAREIHDSLSQGFVGVSVQLEVVSRLLSVAPDKARDQLDQARVLVRHSLAEARRSIWNLRSTGSETDLPASLAEFIRSVSTSEGTNIALNVSGAYRPVPKSVERELLKIAQEAIVNALRHANARHINVELMFGPSVRLTIKDDGQGFDVTKYTGHLNGHYGLSGMRERAAKIHATITIDSCLGSGTEIVVNSQPDVLEPFQV